jgi:hypothetical protein
MANTLAAVLDWGRAGRFDVDFELRVYRIGADRGIFLGVADRAAKP